MRFRFTLSNETKGALILEKNPEGWETMEVLIKRGLDTHGLFYEQAVNLKFFCNGAGKEYIDEVRDEQGIDAVIGINIEVACGCDVGEDAPDYSIDYSDDYGSMSEGDCQWDEFYVGILDMKTWNSDDIYTNVNIIQSDFFQKVRNRLDTKVDLFATETLDGTALDPFTYGPYDLTLHSKVLREKGEYNFITTEDVSGYSEEGNDVDDYNVVFAGSPRIIEHSFCQTLMPEVPVFDEIEGYNDAILNSMVRSATYPGDNTQLQSDILFEVLNTEDNVYTISGKIKCAIKADLEFTAWSNLFAGTFRQDILNPTLYVKAGGAIIYQETKPDILYASTLSIFTGGVQTLLPLQEFTFEFSEDVTLGLADTIQVYFKFDSHKEFDRPLPTQDYTAEVTMYGYVNEDYDVDVPCNVTIITDSTTEATEAESFAIFEAGARIAQVISDQVDPFRSEYFGRINSEPYSYLVDGCGSKRGISNGFMIRGFPTTGDNARTIRMSMNEYFQGLNCIDNLGLGIEKTGDDYFVVIDRKEYFYDSSTVLLTFNNVPNLVKSEAQEYYFGNINIGYDKWETEFTNGLDEFNSKRKYNTGIKAVPNELNIISSLVASGYRLEVARRQRYLETVTDDGQYDEDNFVICLNKDDLTIAEKDENFDQVNNIISPETSYNIRLAPERNYLRWNNVINAGLTKYAGRNVKFTSGEGNYKMSSEFTDDDCPGSFNNELLTGGIPIQWDDVNNSDKDPIWIPETASFKFPISYTNFKILLANPKGVIMVSDTDANHIPYFILEVRYIPGNGGLAEFKLLRAFE